MDSYKLFKISLLCVNTKLYFLIVGLFINERKIFITLNLWYLTILLLFCKTSNPQLKMKKTLLFITLLVCVNASFSQDKFIINEIAYQVTGENTVEITSETTATGDVVIPATVPNSGIDYQVTSIGENAFRKNGLTSVEIPNSVTSIGYCAFIFNALTSVEIPNSVTSIGYGAFAINALTRVTIPNSVTSIGDNAFRNNDLISIEIPDSVTSIGSTAFGLNALTRVTIPNSVTSISYGTFAFNELTSVEIPNSVTSIGFMAFFVNDLTSVTIPDSVTFIDFSAFEDNPDLKTVISEGTTPATLDEYAFVNRSEIDLIIPAGDAVFQAYLDAGWAGFKSVTNDDNIALAIGGDDNTLVAGGNDNTLAIGDVILNDQDVVLQVKENLMRIVTSEATKLKSYSVYDLSGNLVLSGSQDTVSVAQLSHGIYIVALTFDSGLIINKKFAK